jgi:hypothetical protein
MVVTSAAGKGAPGPLLLVLRRLAPDCRLSSLLAKLFVVTVVGAVSLYTQLNSINKEKK